MTDQEQRTDSTKDPSFPSPGSSSFWSELRRRKVIRVTVVYAVVAWLVIQIAATTFPSLSIPEWALSLVTMCVILGFPISIVLAWAFELTPEGIKTTKVARDEHSETADRTHVQSKRNWLAYVVGGVIPTLIFGILAIFFIFRSDTHLTSSTDKSIAVLPLENMSPDQENAFFAGGVQEAILNNLSKVKELLVIGRTSTLGYADTTKKLREIGEELRVRYLVQGSVLRDGNQVRVNVQLIDARTEGQLWGHSYDRDLDDVFVIISTVAKEIAGELHAVLSPEEIAEIERPPTENQEAYDYFMKAREALTFDGRIASNLPEQLSLLEKAVEIDPDFVSAWKEIALTSLLNWSYRKKRNDPVLLAKAKHAIREVERLAPDQVYALKSSLVYNEQNDIEASISYLLAARAADPTNVEGQSLGLRYLQSGRLVKAQYQLEEILTVTQDLVTAKFLYSTYIYRGMWNKAQSMMQDAIERAGDSWGEHRNRGIYIKELSQADYLRSGIREDLIAGMETVPGYMDQPEGQARKSLILRDYQDGLRQLKDLDLYSRFYLIATQEHHHSWTLSFQPPYLVAALIHFKLEGKGRWLEETRKAQTYLDEVLEVTPIVDPEHLSLSAICYALVGDRERMKEMIPKVRELTASVNWQFRRQVECEMHLAIAYLVLGDHDKAIEILEAASKMHSPIFLNRELDLWFIFDRLRGDPRFDALLKD